VRTRIFAGAERFVQELHGRWMARRKPAALASLSPVRYLPPSREMPDHAVFISYAREDLPAVQNIKAGLEAAGITTWFDMDRLEAGDDYDRKIRHNIARCSYFIPVISANTERRVEAYLGRAGRTAEAVTASKAVLAAERRLASRNRTDRLQPYELALARYADALAEPAHAAANLAEAAKIMNSLQPQVAALVGPKELRGWIRQAQARH
jgi:hypothetical protein